MENMESITLYDENGNPQEYELIDLFELNDKVYGGFAPLINKDNQDEEEVEVIMLKIIETKDGEAFCEIDDESEELEAFNELVRRSDEEDDE